MGLKFDYKEGQTPLDEEEKEGLKIKSITTQGELDEFEQLNREVILYQPDLELYKQIQGIY